MNRCFLLLILILLGNSFLTKGDDRKEEEKYGLIPYKEYYGNLGKDYSGMVFILRYYERLVAVMSRHQFDDKVPSRAENIVDDVPIPLVNNKVFLQEDVQILPLQNQQQKVQYVEFSPDYTLKAGEALWIARGGDGEEEGTSGTLMKRELTDGIYHPSMGHRELVMVFDTTADVRGASGMPVFQVSTGFPVGVLLSADDGENASFIIFEPIRLPIQKE